MNIEQLSPITYRAYHLYYIYLSFYCHHETSLRFAMRDDHFEAWRRDNHGKRVRTAYEMAHKTFITFPYQSHEAAK